MMKAVIYEKYGAPDVLKLKEIDTPIAGDNEVLIKVHAASVNSWDWDRLTGKPYLYQLISGIGKPKLKILGADVAEKVEAIGSNVSKFKPGDEVYGDLSEGNWGGFAEYVCAPEKSLVIKPSVMTFEAAAAIPQAGVMALQGIMDQRSVRPGQRILMNGAAGGVGTFAIQLAKMLGAHVTAVDSGAKMEFMRTLGADEVIDYTRVDFTKNGQQYDLILDVVANKSVRKYLLALKPGGVYAMIGGKISTILQIALLGALSGKKSGKNIGILVHKPNKGLEKINELFSTGKIKPIIDKVFPLDKTSEALQYVGAGKVMGKVVIKVSNE
jgi:NADPH:quinone reductase-like Zn-dependent oxidoreductase